MAGPPRRRARLRRRVERPPAHWGALALALAVLVLLLLVNGLASQTTGESGTPDALPGHSPLEGTGPVLVERRGRLVPRPVDARRRIALTFDDGPDPRWTRRIARVLRRLDAPATFFVLGSRVTRHPEVARELAEQGFELGNHGFTHSDLEELPAWRRELELSLTDTAVAGAAGVRPRLLRPPYSARPEAVTSGDAEALAELAAGGHVVTLSTLDSEDWRRPGVAEIVENATPEGSDGAIVLMHDGGGDRSQTVVALERLVPRLRQRGFELVTASQLARLPAATAQPAASSWERDRGRLLNGALAIARWTTAAFTIALIPIAVLALARALALLALARRHARAVRRRPADEGFAPPVAAIVPAYNEAVGIEATVRSLARSDYPELEIVVVDDGSSDGTGDVVERLELPHVRVLRQPNAGKSAALNAGAAVTGAEIVVTLDGDTVFERDTIRRLVRPFADPRVGAVSGNTKVGNRRSLLGRWQHIEYVMGFNLDRRLFDVLRCMPTVPGAVGAFRRDALEAVGGWSGATLAEDTDLTIAIGRTGRHVVYEEGARAWTEAPASLSALWRQRYRWSYGTLQSAWKHRAALVRRGEGPVGRRGIPYLLLFQVVLPLLAPLIDLFALYGLMFLDPLPVGAYWLGFQAFLLLLGWYAFRLDGESPRALWAMPLQQLVYRQLMYLVVIQSVASAFLGTRLRWQHVERTGEVEIATAARPSRAGRRG